MADLLNPLKKRDVLYGVRKTAATELSRHAGSLLDQGWLNDAADFAHQAKDINCLKKIKATALDEGNTFLLLKCGRFLQEDDKALAADLLTCAENGVQQGKIRYAIMAFEKLGQSERAQELRASVALDGDMAVHEASGVFIPSHGEELEEENSVDESE